MATWLYNTVFGTAPQQVIVASSSAAPPPAYHSLPHSSADIKPPPPITPLSLPSLDLLRRKRTILASASPRRKELLALLGLTNLEILPSTFAEDLDKRQFAPWEYVRETALQKCTSVYTAVCAQTGTEEPALVLAADTIIATETGEILEKPRNPEHHFRMLKTLRDAGRHKVYTAVVAMAPLDSLTYPGYAQETSVEETVVVFDPLATDELLRAYVACGEGRDKAGGYAVQGTGSILIKRIEGSWDNVVGLPLRSTLRVIETALSGDEMEEEPEDEATFTAV